MNIIWQDTNAVNHHDGLKISKSTHNPIAYLEQLFSQKEPVIYRSNISVRSTTLICDVAKRFGYKYENGRFTNGLPSKNCLSGFQSTQEKILKDCKARPLVEPKAGSPVAKTLELFKKEKVVSVDDTYLTSQGFVNQVSILRKLGWCIIKLEVGGYQLVERDYEF